MHRLSDFDYELPPEQIAQHPLPDRSASRLLVLERQTALTNARGNELRAQTDLNKSIAELQRATGNALEANHVIVNVH